MLTAVFLMIFNLVVALAAVCLCISSARADRTLKRLWEAECSDASQIDGSREDSGTLKGNGDISDNPCE